MPTPETEREERRLAGLRLLRDDLRVFCGQCLKVKPKTGSQLMPFLWNEAQLYLHGRLEAQRRELGFVRALVLKGRQQGVSTYVAARFYHRASMTPATNAFIVAHEQKSTANLYAMVRRYHDHNPLPVSTGATNAQELIFDRLDSGYKLATAGTKDVGRGNTAQLLHGSEIGFWSNAEQHMAGIGNTIADMPGTEIILESTANGLGNYFHQAWQRAESGQGLYIPIFVPWFWQQEYRSPARPGLEIAPEDEELMRVYGLTLDQMQWRADKIASYGAGFSWLFKQEYPMCISGDARVGTARGLIPMREVAAQDDISTGRVQAAWSNGVRPVVRLRTKLGYTVTCTPDHPIGMGDGSWLRADQTVGRRLLLQQPQASREMVAVSWPLFGGVTAGMVIDERWGRLLGLIAGDGGLSDRTLSIACDSKDADLISMVESLVRELVSEPSVRHGVGNSGGGSEVRAWSSNLGDMWRALGILEEGPAGWKRKVCVPECIWRSPLPVVREFLRGLFEADGFANYGGPRVSLFSKHAKLLEEVQQLLLLFGITARRVSRPAVNGKGFEYTSNTLDLRVSESLAFADRIGFLSARKQSRCDEWRAHAGRGRPPRPMELADEVEAVEPAGEAEVFDMTVPGRECFDAGGILVHNCPAEAFQTGTTNPLVSPTHVTAAAAGSYYDEHGPLILACDPAGDGDGTADRTSIVLRRGRVVLRVEYHDKLNTMQVAGKLADLARDEQPDHIVVDKGGLGAGVVDRLRELGFVVVDVMFGQQADQPELYANKRAEMWHRMRDWFADQPVRIPNDPALISDVCSLMPDTSSNGRKALESKESLKRRGIRSPDGGDALALTFAYAFQQTVTGEPGSTRHRGPASHVGY